MTTSNRVFLLDSGFTGYAQVFEESINGILAKSYTLGDDVLAQTVSGVTSYLQYDGHGSTRLLTDSAGAVTDRYDYDAYGVNLFSANATSPATTDLLYSGEQFDPNLQQQYLRARYYDQNNGRFNRLDPFAGNNYDPQSLHKYAYTHCDPVNATDPTGKMSLNNLMLGVAVRMQMFAMNYSAAFAVVKGIIATVNIIAFLSSAEYREIFIASSPDPLSAMNILAVDIRLVGAGVKSIFSNAQNVSSTIKNIATLRYRTGDLAKFWRKGRMLQNGSSGGGLTVVQETTSTVRPRARKAQQIYREAVKARYIKLLENTFNFSPAEAKTMANAKFSALHVDHRIDLQVGGDPTDFSNLKMLDGSVNTSIGRQLQSEIRRMGLKEGDIIHEILIEAPPLN